MWAWKCTHMYIIISKISKLITKVEMDFKQYKNVSSTRRYDFSKPISCNGLLPFVLPCWISHIVSLPEHFQMYLTVAIIQNIYMNHLVL